MKPSQNQSHSKQLTGIFELMTIKDLQKLVTEKQRAPMQRQQLFEKLRDKPFWIWEIEEHNQVDIATGGNCCFNHII
jgi:hypothetical protein